MVCTCGMGNGVGHYKMGLAEDAKTTATPHGPDIAEEVVPIEYGVVAAEGVALGEIGPEMAVPH